MVETSHPIGHDGLLGQSRILKSGSLGLPKMQLIFPAILWVFFMVINPMVPVESR